MTHVAEGEALDEARDGGLGVAWRHVRRVHDDDVAEVERLVCRARDATHGNARWFRAQAKGCLLWFESRQRYR